MDHGRPIEFGISVIPNAADLDAIRSMARAADETGVDLIGIQDHPYQWRFLDTLALIGELLARTSRVRMFPDVACLPMRPPALLAKQAATLDMMSGGRFELGLGAGSFWEPIAAMGGIRRAPGEAAEALEEAIGIIRGAWSGQRSVRLRGRHYTVDGYHPGPQPAHEIGVWIGAHKPRGLRLIGRLADGWIPSLGRSGITGLARSQAVIDEAARASGRDPSTIRRMLNVAFTIGDPGERGEQAPPVGAIAGDAALGGDVDTWVDRLSGWAVDLGFDTFVLWPSNPDDVSVIGAEIGPRTRAEVARRRPAEAAG